MGCHATNLRDYEYAMGLRDRAWPNIVYRLSNCIVNSARGIETDDTQAYQATFADSTTIIEGSVIFKFVSKVACA